MTGDIGAFLYTFDRGILLVVNDTLRNPLFDLLMPVLSNKWLGLTMAAVVIPLLSIRYGRRAWPVIALAVLTVALSDLGAGLIKHAVQRVRPCHVIAEVNLLAGCTRSFAMPSNHASNMFALAGAIGVLLPGWRWALLILAAGVGYSRMYLGVHYPADVLVGALWGGGLGCGIALTARWLLPTTWMPRRTARSKPSGRDPTSGL
ncbi:MAG: phosphatase PAP2 family protein [Zetaproteobacteria bacterium]|nr:MAG: phosphatase PAP2 family protein [Zetaproteobacteria bacterium]